MKEISYCISEKLTISEASKQDTLSGQSSKMSLRKS